MRRPPTHLLWLVALAAAYTLVVAVSNLLVDKFIDLGPFGMLSAGTLTFGATFTLRDMAHQSSDRAGLGRTPVIAMIGVNGSGKTTTSAKLAWLLKQQGRTTTLAACATGSTVA